MKMRNQIPSAEANPCSRSGTSARISLGNQRPETSMFTLNGVFVELTKASQIVR